MNGLRAILFALLVLGLSNITSGQSKISSDSLFILKDTTQSDIKAVYIYSNRIYLYTNKHWVGYYDINSRNETRPLRSFINVDGKKYNFKTNNFDLLLDDGGNSYKNYFLSTDENLLIKPPNILEIYEDQGDEEEVEIDLDIN